MNERESVCMRERAIYRDMSGGFCFLIVKVLIGGVCCWVCRESGPLVSGNLWRDKCTARSEGLDAVLVNLSLSLSHTHALSVSLCLSLSLSPSFSLSVSPSFSLSPSLSPPLSLSLSLSRSLSFSLSLSLVLCLCPTFSHSLTLSFCRQGRGDEVARPDYGHGVSHFQAKDLKPFKGVPFSLGT